MIEVMVALILICVALVLLVGYMCVRKPDPRQQFIIEVLKNCLPVDDAFPSHHQSAKKAS